MAVVSLYDVLGVPPAASQEQIVAAYRRAARRTHPDAGGSEQAFERVSRAYEVLGDPERRRDYDRRTHAHPVPGQAAGDAPGRAGRTEWAERTEWTEWAQRGVRRRYLAMMAVCVTLFVLAGGVIRLVSVPAALAMMLVAALIPPVAALIANRSR
ncbi:MULTISPECIES: J domain-containing protein [Protofrankia]|uniref:Heat shock protein DnaJ domain protein n=1 Tax=Candidatus Protofrankia datiscae TaxID=2716812 RepID=F8B2F8_9ACTN|nr:MULTISPECIES: J domain-containing protein [Protofrankia]AEH10836.1 heat shock protein DnaJ domain protein [Candidatus Protofrankia datiscae]